MQRWWGAGADTVCQGSAHPRSLGHRCPPGFPLRVPVQRQSRLCCSMAQPAGGARVGMAAAVPEPFVTAGLRFLLALQQRHRDACCRSPHNMFALISQLPPDSPKCRAPPRRGGRCAPAEPRRAGEPRRGPAVGQAGMEGAGQAAPETAVRLDATWGDDAGNAAGTGKGCARDPLCPSTLTQGPGCAASPGNAKQGERPDPDPRLTAAPPAPRRQSRFATTHRRHGRGSARRKRVQHRPARCCFWGRAWWPPRSPSQARA